jgi:HEAT repeat protein
VSLKTAALTGIFIAGDEDPVSFLSDHLQREYPSFHRQVISLVYKIPEPQGLGKIFENVPGLPPASRMVLFVALAARGDRSARQAVLDGLADSDPVIRMAAVRSLPGVGEPADALLLASLAAESSGNMQEMARQSLDMLPEPGTNAYITEAIKTTEGAVRAELIRSSGERNITGAVGLLLHYTDDGDADVRIESLRALGKLAAPEYLPEMIDILIRSGSRREQQEAERTVLALTQKLPEGSDKSAAIIEKLPSVTDEKAVISLLSILGNIGDPADLPVLRIYLAGGSDEVQLAVIRALSGWTDASPLQDLRTIVEQTTDQRKHALAMRGYVDLALTENALTPAAQLIEIKHALSLASDAGEKKIAVSGLNRIGTLAALETAISLLDDPDISKEAEAAVIRIADNTSWDHPRETKEQLNKVMERISSEQLQRRMNEIIERIE